MWIWRWQILNHQFTLFSPNANILATIGWILTGFCTDVHAPQRKNLSYFGHYDVDIQMKHFMDGNKIDNRHSCPTEDEL